MQLSAKAIGQILQHAEKRDQPIPGYVSAAVLMLLFNREGKTYIVYIRRPTGMRLHSGNMAFPGGKIDPEDATSYAAAVRETREEIGVEEDQFVYIGEMGFFETLTSGYDAAVHVAWCPLPPKYRVNRAEVAEIVEIPLDALWRQFRPDLDFQDREAVMYLGFRYRAQDSDQPANLWGLTARITHHFLLALSRSRAAE